MKSIYPTYLVCDMRQILNQIELQENIEVNTERLYKDVEFLTSIYPYRNYKNVASLDKAAAYIKNELEEAMHPVSVQEWEFEGETYKNIIAKYKPELKKRFILGAHYDVYKEQEGADDNASSVAGLLEIARILQKLQPELEYGIDLIAYSLEEPPLFKKPEMGSAIHADSIQNKDIDYIGMIALEMIGYYEGKPNSDKNKKELFVSGIQKYSSYNKKVSDLLKTPALLASRNFNLADDNRNNGPSDHRNYWDLGIPAAMIIGSGGNGNPNYHTDKDTIETLDFETMTKAVSSIAYMLINFKSKIQ